MRITFKEYTKMMPLNEMRPSKFQTNKHEAKQIESLAKIMREHGVRHPISISNQTNTICFGHGRREAAMLNGWLDYPVIFQDFLSEDEERAAVTSDNAIALRAELDFSRINEMIADFDPSFDIDLMGVENLTIDVADKIDLTTTSKDKEKKVCPQCRHEF